MSKPHDDSYLLDIFDSAEQIKIFTDNMSIYEFEKDLKCNLAIQRLFEIIGEATKILSTELCEKNPQVDWKAMAGVREILIHQYQNASSERIFKIARNNIPDLISKIRSLIKK
jgi:uncharacterized protein with HEPN domain